MGIALTALLISALALTFSAGAQDGGLPSGGDSPYADPQPCGPGAGDAFMPEPHEITEGHFALFDAYWEDTSATESVDPGGQTGVLHTNTCPPVVTQTSGRGGTTLTTLSDSTLDIEEAIFHVLEKHKVDVVATNAEITDGQLSLQEYPALAEFVDAGDTVWWLRLDDPDTSKDDASDLTLGFSTRLLVGDQKWHLAGGGDPLSYQLEVERYPSHATGLPHFFAYRAPQSGNATQTPVWSSATAGTSALPMPLGKQIEDLQWIFTDEGTYEIWVELVAHVRQYGDDDPDKPEGWAPISPNNTETSEVKRYVIQVGDFEEEEPPLFGLNLSVPENSAPGTVVSPPLPILEAEADKLYYTLSGDGSDQFALETTTDPHTVQIVVADGADLDYETTPSYELRLSVTDRLDHESNKDLTIDDVLGINIMLEDEPGKVVIEVSDPNPVVGDTVTFTAKVTEFGQNRTLSYEFSSKNRPGIGTASPTYALTHHGHFADVVALSVSYHQVEGDSSSESVAIEAEPVTVTWSAP